MFGKRITLFKLLGFEVRVDLSWVVIAVLIAWSLSAGLFPYQYRGLSRQTYLLMGIAGALGLFLSIIIHEFCHSIVARRQGIPMKGITLFIFGGVAEMGEEPPNAKSEFLMAAVGPLSSFGISILFYGLHLFGRQAGLPQPVNGIIMYLSMINAILAGFNLLPAFPLDGGRMLRSILWSWKKNIRAATRISSKIGSGFAYGFMFLGVVSILRGNVIGGMWWILIGMFLQGAARTSYQQLLVRRAMEGEQVRRFMQENPVTVSPSLSLQELVEDYMYKYHFKMFPVVDSGKLVGCVMAGQVKDVPREEWGRRTVGAISQRCSQHNTIEPEADAMKALSLMNQSGISRLMVVDRDRLVGIISLKDLLRFISLKVELED